jgi:hypothetical protein
VAALDNGNNTGFIYVIGGLIRAVDGCDFLEEFTSSAVQIGVVDASGDITWSSATALPSGPIPGSTEPSTPRGVEQASATVVRTASGRAFLYLIGGLSTFVTIGDPSTAERTVFYAQIDQSTGALGPWVRGEDVPVIDPSPETTEPIGIFDHAATAVTSVENSGAASLIRDGIVVYGGLVKPTNLGLEANAFLYSATINPDSGAVTWDQDPGVNNTRVTLAGSAQYGTSAVSYNNKLYMIGGRVIGGTPLATVQTAIFNDSLLIEPISAGSGDFFVGGSTNVLPNGGRRDAGVAVMEAVPPADNPSEGIGSAWVFGVGGADASSGSPFIFRGRIGGEEADTRLRASEGWYYSNVFDVTFQRQGQAARNARVLSIRWAAEVNRASNANADMVVQFRKTVRADPTCPNESVFSTTAQSDRWITLDGDPASGFFSKSGSTTEPFNTVTLREVFGTEEFIATCFQYRVRFIQNGIDSNNRPIAGADPSGTPRLFAMLIEKVVAGSPDIRIPQGGFSADVQNGRMVGLTTVIQNLNLAGLPDTQDAGLDQDGSFYVHLCVAYAPPGQPAPTLDLPTLPLADGTRLPCMVAYYDVYKWQMRAGQSLAMVPSGEQVWRDPNTSAAIADVRSLFSQPGSYKVAMLIDAWNYVAEGTAGEANNLGQEEYSGNQPQVLAFEITGTPINLVRLPLIRR